MRVTAPPPQPRCRASADRRHAQVEAVLRVHKRFARRDNIYKARIKILVHELGLDAFATEVEAEWQSIKDGSLALDPAVIADTAARFRYPDYERLDDNRAELARDTVPVIVPAARFIADAEGILRREAPTGALWPNNRSVAELGPYLDRLSLIALAFPTFKDGRAYSGARLLRERLGFRGELRTTGQILRDQFLFLVRAGFDALDVVKGSDAAAFAAAIAHYSVFYQTAGDGRLPAARYRISRILAGASSEVVH